MLDILVFVDPSLNEVIWARRPLPDTRISWGKSAEPRWHRVALVDDTAIKTICDRILLAPVDMQPEVPGGEHACRLCVKRAERRKAATQH